VSAAVSRIRRDEWQRDKHVKETEKTGRWKRKVVKGRKWIK
jgi:hypothetical protein